MLISEDEELDDLCYFCVSIVGIREQGWLAFFTRVSFSAFTSTKPFIDQTEITRMRSRNERWMSRRIEYYDSMVKKKKLLGRKLDVGDGE